MAIGESMAQCPECQAEITEDFGLITCSGCGASLLVDMEGDVVSQKEQFDDPSESFEAGEMVEEFEEPIAEEPLEAEPPAGGEMYPEEAFEEEEPIEESEEPESAVYSPAPQYGSEEEVEPSIIEEMNLSDEAEEAPVEEGASLEENFFEDEQENVPVYNAEPVSSDMNDVVDFANSDQSQGRDGGLQYTLKLSGIDTMDLRYAIKEALTDKRFIWDLEAMMRGIQDGVLLIEQISAIKAYIVVSRVAHLPIGISWTQQALSQP